MEIKQKEGASGVGAVAVDLAIAAGFGAVAYYAIPYFSPAFLEEENQLEFMMCVAMVVASIYMSLTSSDEC